MQPNSSLPQGQPPIMGTAQPPRKSMVGTIILSIFLCLFMAATAWMGYRAVNANKALAAANEDLTALQGNYETLTGEKTALDTELVSVKAELEAAQKEIATTQEATAAAKSDTSKVKQEIAALKENMQKAWLYAEVLRGAFEDNDGLLETLSKVVAVEDDKLTNLFNSYLNTGTDKALDDFIIYLVETAVELLKQ